MSPEVLRAVTFAVTLPVLLVAHTVADHWVQTSHQSAAKGGRSWAGRWACVRHVASYTLVTAVAVASVWWLFSLPISPAGFVAGQVLSAVTHYWADRRFTLARLAKAAGKGEFYRFGAPREGRDDNPGIGTGAYALDQSFHWLMLTGAGLLTAVVA
ncbi:transcriptional regulator [Actinosynnema sp. NPDC023587]|uniref:transcriptional regulator n=1 Tax=Actinosynnema sp. NPDC023587 TaxID=3154695 RepID=UPI0033E2691F